jgi:hypothetical protein
MSSKALRLIGSTFLIFFAPGLSAAQFSASQAPAAQTPGNHSLLNRPYQIGEKLVYHMKATNRGRTGTTAYEADASAVVKKDAGGNFVEEYAWSNFVVNDKPVELSAAARDFRQPLSLDPGSVPSVPNLSQVIPLVGPITDLLTFYSDLWLADRLGTLNHAGDHFYFARGTPTSWADGAYTLIGEDSVDFDLTLADVDTAGHTATLAVRHVPPAKPQIKLPAAWMHAPVGDTPNNWVQVAKTPDGKYSGQIGKETFDVELKVSLVDGRILSATLDNPVEVLERECTDLALTNCGDPVRYQIRRQIEITQ